MELDRKFLKKLWNGEKVMCPKCNKEYLIPLHKKRKDNDDFQCTNYNFIFRKEYHEQNKKHNKKDIKKIEIDTLHSICPQCFPKEKLTKDDVK